MPPKKAQNETASVVAVAIGEYDILKMTQAELQGFAFRMQQEVEKVRVSLNYHHVERDKIERFWEISKKELGEKEAELLSLRKQIEDTSRKYGEQQHLRNHKLEYFKYNYRKKVGELEKDSKHMKHIAQVNVTAQRKKHKNRWAEQESELQIMQTEYEKKFYKTDQERKLFMKRMIRHQELKIEEAVETYEKMYYELRNNLNLLKNVEVRQYEEQKRKEYREYVERHAKGMEEMKLHFKKIIGSSLSLIDVLKTEISVLKNANEKMRETRTKHLHENQTLLHIMKEARVSKIQMAHLMQDKKSNAFTERRIGRFLLKIKELETTNRKLSEVLNSTSSDKEDLKMKFVSLLRDIQNVLMKKNEILVSKVDDLASYMQERGVPISEIKLQPVDYRECYKHIPK